MIDSAERFMVELREGRDSFAVATAGLSDEVCRDLFCTRAWFENLATHGMRHEVPILLATVHDLKGHDSFCLPLQRLPTSASAMFGPVTEGLCNFYSGLYEPIGAEQAPSIEACEALLRGLGRANPNCNVINFHPLDADGPFCANMTAALARCGYWTDHYFCFGNWYLEVHGRSFADYEKGLPSRLRNTIRRARRKLDASGTWTLDIVHQPGPGLESAIQSFEAIYRQSWKQPEPHAGFIGALCRMAAQQKWLRLGVLKVDGQPAAAQIWLTRHGRALIYKLAHDERLKQFSAGSVLTASLLQHALDVDGAAEVDFLTGDEPYKADWMSHRRERVGVVAFRRRTLQGQVSALRHFVGRWLRVGTASQRPAAPVATTPATIASALS